MLRPSAHHISTANPLSILLHFMKNLWLVLFRAFQCINDYFIFIDTAAQSNLNFLLRIRRISKQSPRIPIASSKGDNIHVIRREIQISSIPQHRFSLRCIRFCPHSHEVLISERPYPVFVAIGVYEVLFIATKDPTRSLHSKTNYAALFRSTLEIAYYWNRTVYVYVHRSIMMARDPDHPKSSWSSSQADLHIRQTKNVIRTLLSFAEKFMHWSIYLFLSSDVPFSGLSSAGRLQEIKASYCFFEHFSMKTFEVRPITLPIFLVRPWLDSPFH